jgi:hypothetical protein
MVLNLFSRFWSAVQTLSLYTEKSIFIEIFSGINMVLDINNPYLVGIVTGAAIVFLGHYIKIWKDEKDFKTKLKSLKSNIDHYMNEGSYPAQFQIPVIFNIFAVKSMKTLL